MASLRILKRVSGSAIAFGWLVAVVSCGSRTGLFVPEAIPDGSIGTADVVDASRDVALDAPKDAIEEPTACIPGTFSFTPAIPQLMFVLDRSGSMNFVLTSNRPADPGEQTRWRALQESFSAALTPFSSQIAMGARFFPVVAPLDDDLACVQDPPSSAIIPAIGNAATILDVFNTTTPRGGTPTAGALEQALTEVSSSRAVSRAIVVATDGAPNCNPNLDQTTCVCTEPTDPTTCQSDPDSTRCLDDTHTIQTILTIHDDHKIPVFVIGIGALGSFGTTLDDMAQAGGTARSGSPRYFPGDTPAALTDAFTTIRDSVAKCSYITPSSPTDPNAITVEIDGKVVFRDPTRTDGWDWIDQAYGHLQLFGSACTLATSTNVSGTVACDQDR